ncbi:hypothetical protein ACFU44_13800 [Nocardia rhizosphaerihabitans]|uniref:portal protein n=1 Tax=Nocardia rhizosphaerihabitans TaxID=1691570 RepID=UPI0036721B09
MASTEYSKANDDLLKKTMKRFDDSWDYAASTWHRRWERDWKLYNNERYRKNYEGITDTFVPMTFSTIETMAAALGNGRPRFDYEADDPMKSETSTKPLNALTDEFWEADQWDVKVYEGIREMLKKGTSPFMMYWDIDRPRLITFDIRDFIVDPTCTSQQDIQERGYAGRRFFVRKGTLDDYMVVDTDPDSKTYGELVKRYKDIDEESTSPTGDNDSGKKATEMFMGSTLKTAAEDQDELIEIWDKDSCVTVKNRKCIIENRKNAYKERHEMKLREKYQAELDVAIDPKAFEAADQRAKAEAKGVIPFFLFRNYTDVNLIYAKSEIEPIAPLQEQLNDMSNQEGDSIIKQLAQQRELDPQYQDWIDLIDDDPSTVYPFTPGSLKNIDSPQVPPNSFNNRMNIKNEIRETTAIDQVAKGSANVKDTTATEVKAQLNQAGQRIEIKARLLEKDGFYWMAKILFHMVQLYVDRPQAVRVNTDGTQEVTMVGDVQLPPGVGVYNPADFEGDWQPHVTLEVDSQNKKVEQQRSALQMYQILIQDPTNNLAEIKRIYLPKITDLDQAELDAILSPSPEQAMMDPAMAGGAPAEMPMEVPNGA